ncbi:hypothetical protein COV24_01920 [candidate division WWE3 bacterium CG10_big_fil_rev_8_21_14_0_10_32_10]|uniref:DUF5667 domain-containing protein n=1 Tax=candidate division WWE3 bacterium CG10_big_fil_rev_8_21_14_0_10_32_10 TaxID=1975090 RepID=A0A2H0RAK8_UNCKA|nr:MAG: hypothetical protein COV24_01920 [candidate division WWE3 bacterium CG10_big_fil_rev_8_21_14_0_10_32_10]
MLSKLLIIFILSAFFLVSPVLYASEVYSNNEADSSKNVNEIINENIKESTDSFIKNTSEDLKIYAIKETEKTKKSFIKSITENIKFDEIGKNIQTNIRNMFSSLLESIKNLI